MVFAYLITLFGCNTASYRTFEQLNGTDHYSFQYPDSYSMTVNNAYSDPRAVNGVRFIGKLSDGSEIVLGCTIYNYPIEYHNARGAADRLLSVAGRELIERSSDNISGIPCEILMLYTEDVPSLNLHSQLEKIAFFDYQDRAWDIWVYAGLDKVDQVNNDFDRLIRTFKLLP